MHDCRKTQLQMTDWLFAESSVNYMASIGTCQACYEQFHALRDALNSFDQATDTMMPDETYWAGYEAKLRVRLAQEETPKRWAWLTGPWGRIGWMVPAVVGLGVLLFLAWGAARPVAPPGNPNDLLAGVKRPDGRGMETDQDAPKTNASKRRPEKQQKPKPPARQPEKKPYLLTDPNPILAVAQPFENPANTQHFERAQRLLRAFRNAPASKNETFDLSYEAKRARQLLYENIVLRRDAEARGDWAREELLNDLEPLLLDIANLPQRPTSDDVLPIKERMQKQEIVAKLQLYATPIVVATLSE